MPRFVLLEHDHPVLHWDFMLERPEQLTTFRLQQFPTPDTPIPAEPLPDHRKLYLDYEGPVSGNRGTVQRRDAGEYRLQEETTDCIILEIEGQTIRGMVSLSTESNTGWTFLWRSSHS